MVGNTGRTDTWTDGRTLSISMSPSDFVDRNKSTLENELFVIFDCQDFVKALFESDAL